ncbi:MAG: SAM-dependent methyltransferase [Thermonemataceae bacterium]|nr:SAM-dependent methyltransferase [Thermonemataceae bacterium]
MLYLIPTLLAENTQAKVLPGYVTETIQTLEHFIVEDIRSARRFISSLRLGLQIDKLQFYEIGKRSHLENLTEVLLGLEKGLSVGLLSEAGCPAVADPGASVVAWCQERAIKVVPMVGASSLLLALMASGFNGQSFAFQGYLPIDKAERIQKIKELEKKIYNENQTQIFIETPFRNESLVAAILQTCQHQTKLCIAANITADNESILTKTIAQWRKEKIILHKIPTVFLLYR